MTECEDDSKKKAESRAAKFLDDKDDDYFITLGDILFYEIATLDQLASAIEFQSCYLVDDFGRLKRDADNTSLNVLPTLRPFEYLTDEEKYQQQNYLTEWNSPLNRYGWLKSDLPDIEKLATKWCAEQRKPSADVLPPGDIWKLLLLMATELVGDKRMLDLESERSGTIAYLAKRLGPGISVDTVRKYIKNANPKFRDHIDQLKRSAKK